MPPQSLRLLKCPSHSCLKLKKATMQILHPLCVPLLQRLNLIPAATSNFSRQTVSSVFTSPHVPLSLVTPIYKRNKLSRIHSSEREIIDIEAEQVADDVDEFEDEDGDGDGGFSSYRRPFSGREEEKDYDKDPEFAEILGSCFDDPAKAQARVEERIRSKRNKILQPKTGSATPTKVTFNKKTRLIIYIWPTDFKVVLQTCVRFDFSNSYIWFEFYNAPLPNDISLISDTIRSWHIIGRLGGCNSMNMQLSQAPLDKRPSYDPIQGANVTPTTFYNIGDFEVQENLGRVWMDIGTSEPLLLDVLINALTQISSDYVGIKQLVFGGSEFENWNENLTSEAAGYSVHKI